MNIYCMHNSCLFLLKCQLMKTYLKGSIPREAQAAGRDGMQSHTVSCHTETQGSSDGPLHSPAATYSFSLGARPGGASAVTLLTHLPQRKVFTFVPELNLAKLCQFEVCTPSTGDGVAKTLQDKDAVDAGMWPRMQAGSAPSSCLSPCPLLLTCMNV